MQDETGRVEIPSDPQRMVIAHVSAMATVLDLGVSPEKIVGGFFGHEGVGSDAVLRKMAEAANIPNLDTAGTWSKEAIIGASPDLIFMLLTAGMPMRQSHTTNSRRPVFQCSPASTDIPRGMR
ncbi:hypothetical protein QM716_13505 [Rhodococcus sp. IEGM 1409]|uniref:hypothetical protein n=1 Tax=Rhodococcus sp. IEGM 1409 TaxID=3047082 RepID=UPI0024B64212|nr:hypothetical protein [Rhodococcus sp. IEGM 1409]MDI9900868.1 hypothetical protein [Rhodococcus sp. IEGM 1409]